ncbi:MAG: hypothetical protein ACI93R_003529 [Flavobacteriales bacterium]
MKSNNERFEPRRLFELVGLFTLVYCLIVISLYAVESVIFSLHAELIALAFIEPVMSLSWNYTAQVATPILIVMCISTLFIKHKIIRRTIMGLSVASWFYIGLSVVFTYT